MSRVEEPDKPAVAVVKGGDVEKLPGLRDSITESSVDGEKEEQLDAQVRVNVEPGEGGNASPPEAATECHLGPPPNGGFHAWLQVAGSFFLLFNSWYVPCEQGSDTFVSLCGQFVFLRNCSVTSRTLF